MSPGAIHLLTPDPPDLSDVQATFADSTPAWRWREIDAPLLLWAVPGEHRRLR